MGEVMGKHRGIVIEEINKFLDENRDEIIRRVRRRVLKKLKNAANNDEKKLS